MSRLKKLVVLFFASILLGVAFNLFLLPNEVLTGGVTGLAMVFGTLTPIDPGIWLVILNVPIFVLGWMKLGKEFIGNSIFSVVITSITMQYLPVTQVTDDALLGSVFGGAMAGVAVGFIIRSYGSGGGADIIGLLLTLKRDIPLGALIFAINSVVVFISGFIFSWELAMYTMLSIYITGIVIDRIHTRHVKLSLMVVTNRGEEVKTELLNNLIRGITVMNGQGGYSNTDRNVLYTVITRYELALVKSLITRIDPKAFVSVSETVEVIGNFRR